MKTEKVILSIVAIIVGLAAAGVAFYLYQMTKTIPEEKTINNTAVQKQKASPTPDSDDKNFLTIEKPNDETVVESKSLTISGKTDPKATIIVSTATNDEVVSPAADGKFTLTQTLSGGANLIQILAVFPDGKEKKIIRQVTYATENF